MSQGQNSRVTGPRFSGTGSQDPRVPVLRSWFESMSFWYYVCITRLLSEIYDFGLCVIKGRLAMQSIRLNYTRSHRRTWCIHSTFQQLTRSVWLKEKTQKNRKNSQPILSKWWIGVITSHGACARMEQGNVTNNLRELFCDAKERCKIDCEASTRNFYCYKRYRPIQRRILKPLKHLLWSFVWN